MGKIASTSKCMKKLKKWSTGHSQEPIDQMDSDLGNEQVNQLNRPDGQEHRLQDQGRNITKELKLKMPEFKGKKGDPQVHVQAFENWAVFRELPRKDWKDCFPQTLRGTAQKWYFNYPRETNIQTIIKSLNKKVQR